MAFSTSKRSRFKDASCDIEKSAHRHHFPKQPAQGPAPLAISQALRSMGMDLEDHQVKALRRMAGMKAMDSIIALGNSLTTDTSKPPRCLRREIPDAPSHSRSSKGVATSIRQPEASADGREMRRSFLLPSHEDRRAADARRQAVRRHSVGSVSSRGSSSKASRSTAASRLLATHRNWRDVFLRFPRAADGTVSTPELQSGLKSLAGVSDDHAAALAQAADAEDTGRVDFSGFVSALTQGSSDTPTVRIPSYYDQSKPQGEPPRPRQVSPTKPARAPAPSRPTRFTPHQRRARVLRRRIQDAVTSLYGSDPSRLRRMFLRFNRGGDGSVSTGALAEGLRQCGVSVSESDVSELFQAAMPTSRPAKLRQRVDYDVFHKAIEQLDLEPSNVTKKQPYVHSPPPKKSADATRRTITAVYDVGLEFPDDDPDVAVAKQDVCRKVRGHLASGLAMPRKAFLAVDRNRDALLSSEELRTGLRRVGVELSDRELHHLMAAVDRDHTGVVDYDKFVSTLFPRDYNWLEEDGKLLQSPHPHEAEKVKAEPPPEAVRTSADGLVDEMGMLYVRDETEDRPPAGKFYFHGGTPYLKDEVTRDTKGVPAPYLESSHAADPELVQAKRENAILGRVMNRISEKSSSARAMFLRLDIDHDGAINHKELREGLAVLGAPLTQDEFDTLVNRVDRRRTGRISYSQFARAFKMDDHVPSDDAAPPEVYNESHRTDFYPVTPHSPKKTRHPHRYRPRELDAEGKKPTRHAQDSRAMYATLKGADTMVAATAAEGKMQMQVADKMLAKRKSLRDIFYRLDRRPDGKVPVNKLRSGLATLGITVSDRQVKAFLGQAHAGGDAIDYVTFAKLTRPRAPRGSETPKYIRKADFTSDGRGGHLGFTEEEGIGEFGLVDPEFEQSQQRPAVEGFQAQFLRASNISATGLTDNRTHGDGSVFVPQEAGLVAVEEEHAALPSAGASPALKQYQRKRRVAPPMVAFNGERVKESIEHPELPPGSPPRAEEPLGMDLPARRHFEPSPQAAKHSDIIGVGPTSPQVHVSMQPMPAATPIRPPALDMPGTKIVRPRVAPMDIAGVSRAAVEAAFARLERTGSSAATPPRPPASVASAASFGSDARAAGMRYTSGPDTREFRLPQRRHNVPARQRESSIFSAPEYPDPPAA